MIVPERESGDRSALWRSVRRCDREVAATACSELVRQLPTSGGSGGMLAVR